MSNWLIACYLFYIVAYETLVLGGTGYAVFVLGQSAWWFVLAVVMSGGAYHPERWHALVTGRKPKKDD